MATGHTTSATVDDIICAAKEIITRYGWARSAWPEHGPRPRSIRAALAAAAEQHGSRCMQEHTDALRRVAEAIYGLGSVGGINDYEYHKSTNKDTVIALLQKAIEMGPSPREGHCGVWPT